MTFGQPKEQQTFRKSGENPNPYRRATDPIERAQEGTEDRELEDQILALLQKSDVEGISVLDLITYFRESGPRYEQPSEDAPPTLTQEPGAKREMKNGEEIISVPALDSDSVQDALFTLEAVGMIELRDKKAYLKQP